MSHGSGALFGTLKMAEWQIKEIPFGNHELWKQMLAVLSPSRSLMQMLRVGDSSMINQTGSKRCIRLCPSNCHHCCLSLSIWETRNILSIMSIYYSIYYEYILSVLRRTPCFSFVSDPGVLCPPPGSMEL